MLFKEFHAFLDEFLFIAHDHTAIQTLQVVDGDAGRHVITLHDLLPEKLRNPEIVENEVLVRETEVSDLLQLNPGRCVVEDGVLPILAYAVVVVGPERFDHVEVPVWSVQNDVQSESSTELRGVAPAQARQPRVFRLGIEPTLRCRDLARNVREIILDLVGSLRIERVHHIFEVPISLGRARSISVLVAAVTLKELAAVVEERDVQDAPLVGGTLGRAAAQPVKKNEPAQKSRAHHHASGHNTRGPREVLPRCSKHDAARDHGHRRDSQR